MYEAVVFLNVSIYAAVYGLIAVSLVNKYKDLQIKNKRKTFYLIRGGKYGQH